METDICTPEVARGFLEFINIQGFGLACHLGVLSGIPTIGIGKTLFHVDGIEKKSVKEKYTENCKKGGDYVHLVGDSGHVWGSVSTPRRASETNLVQAFRSTDTSANPIYVSIGMFSIHLRILWFFFSLLSSPPTLCSYFPLTDSNIA